MKISDIANQIGSLPDDSVICARLPWTEIADYRVMKLDENFKVPKKLSDEGFSYFLEVAVAGEVLEILNGKAATDQDKANLLIHYAKHDAYPEWVYRLPNSA